MLINFQFISFYKVTHTKISSNTSQLSVKGTKILTTNIQLVYILLFLRSMLTTKLCAYTLSCFHLPTTKKKTIFLRAPYKNKLARLNIVTISYKFTVTLKFSKTINNFTTFSYFNHLNLSSHKIKHVKTNLQYNQSNTTNFFISNYN